MKINPLSCSPNFGKIYVSNKNMTKQAEAYSAVLEKELDYSEAIKRLDKLGVDVVILGDKDFPKNLEIVFVDSKNDLIKLKGYRNAVNIRWWSEFYPYYEANQGDEVIKCAQQVADKVESKSNYKVVRKDSELREEVLSIKDRMWDNLDDPEMFEKAIEVAGEE